MLEAANVACRFGATLAPMLVFGASTMLAASGQPQVTRRLNERLRHVWQTLSWIGLLAASCLLGIQAALITGHIAALHDSATLRKVALFTSYGHAWMAQAGADLILCVALALPGLRPPALLAGLSACALAAIGVSGHAVMDDGLIGLVHMANNIAHILCSAFWIGALIVVLPLLMSWRDDSRQAAPVMVRFSALGHVAVAGALLTGAIDTWLILRGSGLNLRSPYQQWLAVKIVVALIMTMLALSNRYYWIGRLSYDEQALPALRRQVRYTVAAGALAVLIVALFGTLSPD